MVKSYGRGHLILWDEGSKLWRYADNLEVYDDSRPCLRCGEMPTPEGYDACLGYIEGVNSACCGHGMEEAYQVRGDLSAR